MSPHKLLHAFVLTTGAWLLLLLASSAQQTPDTAKPSGTAQSASQTTTPAAAPTPAASTPQTSNKKSADVAPGAMTGAEVEAESKKSAADAKAKEDAKAKDDKLDVKNQTPVDPGSQMIKVRNGSIDDVNAVGNREIGSRGMGNWYSADWEIRTGKGYSMQIDKATKFITDPVITEYVNRVAQNLVKNSDAKVPFTVKVIDSDEINAMALPGGFFYVNSGLVLAADEEAELAGVMAHEIAHVAAHHAAREMTRMNYTNIGMIPVMIFLPYSWTGYGIYEGLQLAIPVTFLHFSREFEAQADYLGVQYMYRAGYDPQAFVSFFEKIQALEKRKPGSLSKAFSDHPQTPDRIEDTQTEIAQILPAKDEYLVTTSEFDDVKARLARLTSKRRLNDTKGDKKPSLRKAGTDSTDKSSQTTTDSADDKPTLHRRDN